MIARRKRMLQTFLNRAARHPIISNEHVFHRFLQGEVSWVRLHSLDKIGLLLCLTTSLIDRDLTLAPALTTPKKHPQGPCPQPNRFQCFACVRGTAQPIPSSPPASAGSTLFGLRSVHQQVRLTSQRADGEGDPKDNEAVVRLVPVFVSCLRLGPVFHVYFSPCPCAALIATEIHDRLCARPHGTGRDMEWLQPKRERRACRIYREDWPGH